MARKKTQAFKKRLRTRRTPRRKIQGGRGRKMKMSALDANPFSSSRAVHMKSPGEVVLRRAEDLGLPAVIWIYAEWCGHCVRFAPIWETLVSEFPNVRFVMIDGNGEEFQKNYPETYPRVRGYPTLWLMGVGEVEPQEYEKRRDLQTLRETLSEMTDS